MTISPDRIIFDAGKHQTPEDGVCVMELVAIASGQATFSDLPKCTDDLISRAAQRVWDSTLNAAEDKQEAGRTLTRQFLMRIIRARPLTPEARRRVALGAARLVEHLDPTGKAKACNDVHERYLAGEASRDELANAAAATTAANANATTATAAAAAVGAAYATYATAATAAANAANATAYATANAAYATATTAATAATAAANAANATATTAGFMDDLLTLWEKEMAATEEGIWIPSAWEDAALAYVEELCDR